MNSQITDASSSHEKSATSAIAPSRTAKLFEPVRLGQLNVRNRIVMPAMTRTMSPGGVPTADSATYYARRAKGGVGLVIAEGTWIPHDAASNEEDAPRMFGVAALKGWEEIVRQVHDEGVPILSQLWHVGQMKQHLVEGLYAERPVHYVAPRRVGPSGLFGGIGQALTRDGTAAIQADLDSIVESYAKAAVNAKQIGFDGIELHAAHGYLLDQFFWLGTNQRTDSYGGSMRNRIRLATEVVAEIRRSTGPDFAISLRMSQWKVQDFKAKLFESPGDLEEFVAPLVDAGVDVFHCSQRRFWETEFASEMNLAAWTKKISGRPTISVGSVAMTGEHIDTLMGQSSSVSGIDRLLKMIDRGDFDMIAVGRGLLVDPLWPQKVREGRLDKLLPWKPEALRSLA